MILILSGRGSTTVWNDAGQRITFEWKAGAIFAIPLNCWHQHFNGSGQEPARYVGVTSCPSVMNLYGDPFFVFNTPYDFKSRFNGEPDYFSAKGEQKGFLLTTNFVPDAVNIPLISAKERGAGGGHIRFNMAQGFARQPYLAVRGRHLQEGPCAWSGRACDPAQRRRLFADVDGRRGAQALRLGDRHPDRAAEQDLPSAFQHRPDARALSRVQALVAAQRAGRADELDQPPAGRLPDRLCRRVSGACAKCMPTPWRGTA